MSRFSPGFIFPTQANALTNLLYLSTTAAAGGSPTADVTFAAVGLGTARATRYVVCVLWDIGDNNAPQSATIGGVAATVLYNPTVTPNSPYIFGALVPSNANTDVIIHYLATQGGNFGLVVYTMDGTPASANGQFFNGLPASFVGLTVTGKANGAVIAGFQNGKAAGSPSTTWGQGAVTLTADATNVVYTTANYLSSRSKNNYTVDLSTDWGTMTGGTAVVRAFLLSLVP